MTYLLRVLTIFCLVISSFSVAGSPQVSDLQLEYNRLKSEMDAMSTFIIKAKEERASLTTLESVYNKKILLDEDIEHLARDTDALKFKDEQFSISKVWLTDKAKSEHVLNKIDGDNTAYLYVSFIMPKKLEIIKVNLRVSEQQTDKEIVSLERERVRKGEGIEQKTGIALKSDKLTVGKSYQFTAILIDTDGKELSEAILFQYGQPATLLSDITLTVKDESTESANSSVSNNTKLSFIATIPLTKEGHGQIVWQLLDASGSVINKSEKIEQIDENGEIVSSNYIFRTNGLSLDDYTVVVTHQIEQQESSKVKAQFPFKVSGSFLVHGLTVSNSKQGDVSDGVLQIGDKPHLYVSYTAHKAIRMGSFRVFDALTNKNYYTRDVTEDVKVDGKKHRFGLSLKKEAIPVGQPAIFEVNFIDDQGNEFSSQRTFNIESVSFSLNLPERLQSGDDYTLSLIPPVSFEAPYTVSYEPYMVLVNHSDSKPLKLSVTGIGGEGEHDASLQVTLTDSTGRVAVAKESLVIYSLAAVVEAKADPEPASKKELPSSPKVRKNNICGIKVKGQTKVYESISSNYWLQIIGETIFYKQSPFTIEGDDIPVFTVIQRAKFQDADEDTLHIKHFFKDTCVLAEELIPHENGEADFYAYYQNGKKREVSNGGIGFYKFWDSSGNLVYHESEYKVICNNDHDEISNCS